MKIRRVYVEAYDENTYIYTDTATGEGVIIDPGGNAPEILTLIKKEGITPKALLLTHGHYDHLGAVPALQEALSLPLYAAAAERPLLEDPMHNLSQPMGSKAIRLTPTTEIGDGAIIPFGKASLKVILTPGHTAGGCCYYDEAAGNLFSGDTLFYENIGRYDLCTGDGDTLLKSIREKLYSLPEAVRVFPGHGIGTTIGHEKRHNPYTGKPHA